MHYVHYCYVKQCSWSKQTNQTLRKNHHLWRINQNNNLRILCHTKTNKKATWELSQISRKGVASCKLAQLLAKWKTAFKHKVCLHQQSSLLLNLWLDLIWWGSKKNSIIKWYNFVKNWKVISRHKGITFWLLKISCLCISTWIYWETPKKLIFLCIFK